MHGARVRGQSFSPLKGDGGEMPLAATRSVSCRPGCQNDATFIQPTDKNNYLQRKAFSAFWRVTLMTKLICFTAAVSLGATGALAAAPSHFAGANLLPQAKITLAQARS